jgi:hypothetical protein
VSPEIAADELGISNRRQPMSTFPPRVAGAIAQVMAGVTTLGKGNENKHGNYKFAGIDDFLEVTRPLCAAAGLIIFQDEDTCEIIGGDKPWLKITYTFRLTHASGETWDGTIRRTIMVDARMGAQAFGAAQSYVLKQFMRSLFQMATGDGEDADSHAQSELPKERPEPKRAEPKPPTLSERADRFEATLKAVKTEADLDKAFALGSGLCADLDAKDPERLVAVEALVATLRDALAQKVAA